MPSDDLHLPAGYVERLAPLECDDTPSGVTWQPEVYTLAGAFLTSSRWLALDLGCGNGQKLAALQRPGVTVLGVDRGASLQRAQALLGASRVQPCDLETIGLGEFVADYARVVVICADVIEHLVDPRPLLRLLDYAVACGAVVLLSTPERTATASPPNGPPRNECHVREWSMPELRQLLADFNLDPVFLGLTRENDATERYATILAVIVGEEGLRV